MTSSMGIAVSFMALSACEQRPNEHRLGYWEERGFSGELVASGERKIDKKITAIIGHYLTSDTIDIWSEGDVPHIWFSIIVFGSSKECSELVGSDVTAKLQAYLEDEYGIHEGWVHVRDGAGSNVCNIWVSRKTVDEE